MQTQTPSLSTPSSPPSSVSSQPGPSEQGLVLQLFLQAVANKQDVPPNLAVAVLALTPQYRQLLAIKLAQMEQADPESVRPPQPALDALQKARGTRLSNGQMLAKAVEVASEQQRLALYRKGLEAGLLPGPSGPSGKQADQALPKATQLELGAQRKVLANEDQAGKTAELKTNLGVAGRL